jgi:hypothetical protein
LRNCKTKVKILKSESCVNKLINLDEGFGVLRNLRGSPPYFERCKKDLFAMIRQLGNPIRGSVQFQQLKHNGFV